MCYLRLTIPSTNALLSHVRWFPVGNQGGLANSTTLSRSESSYSWRSWRNADNRKNQVWHDGYCPERSDCSLTHCYSTNNFSFSIQQSPSTTQFSWAKWSTSQNIATAYETVTAGRYKTKKNNTRFRSTNIHKNSGTGRSSKFPFPSKQKIDSPSPNLK